MGYLHCPKTRYLHLVPDLPILHELSWTMIIEIFAGRRSPIKLLLLPQDYTGVSNMTVSSYLFCSKDHWIWKHRPSPDHPDVPLGTPSWSLSVEGSPLLSYSNALVTTIDRLFSIILRIPLAVISLVSTNGDDLVLLTRNQYLSNSVLISLSNLLHNLLYDSHLVAYTERTICFTRLRPKKKPTLHHLY